MLRILAQAEGDLPPEAAPAPAEELPSVEIGPWTEALETLRQTGWSFVEAVPTLLLAVVVFAAFWLLGKGVKWSVYHFATEKRKRRNVALVMGRLAHGLTFVLGILVAAVVLFPNFTPTRMLSFLGIGSVAIGFAFRDVFQNYVAGVLLLLREPFRIGDQIVFGEYEGTIEDIETRATFMRTYDGRRVVIPNTELFTNSILVNTAFEIRRLEYDVGIGYGDDIDRAKAVIFEALREAKGVLTTPEPEVLTFELAPSTVVLRVRWWMQPPMRRDVLESRDHVLTTIKNRLTENGIDLPFPTTQVLFHDQTEETDGDRKRQREGWPAGKGEVPKPRKIAGSLLRLAESRTRTRGAEAPTENSHPKKATPEDQASTADHRQSAGPQ